MSHIATLEASLSSLLGKSRDDPWSLLMIQTLLWSFRRWAIFYLTSDELTTTMGEFLWESHFDLVDRFAPEGLRDFAIIWLNPANVGDRAEMLEELNEYFVEVVRIFDISICLNNDFLQNELADFIDERITVLIDRWLDGRSHYRIYPFGEEGADSFSSAKIFDIMESIMTKYITTDTPAVVAVQEPPPEVKDQEPQPEVKDQEPQAEVKPQPRTIAAALNRCRTIRRRGRDLRIKENMTRKNRS